MIEMFGQKLTVQRFDDLRSDHGEIGTPAGSGKLVEKNVSDTVPCGFRRLADAPKCRQAIQEGPQPVVRSHWACTGNYEPGNGITPE